MRLLSPTEVLDRRVNPEPYDESPKEKLLRLTQIAAARLLDYPYMVQPVQGSTDDRDALHQIAKDLRKLGWDVVELDRIDWNGHGLGYELQITAR